MTPITEEIAQHAGIQRGMGFGFHQLAPSKFSPVVKSIARTAYIPIPDPRPATARTNPQNPKVPALRWHHE